MKFSHNNRGFTFIEILVVLALLTVVLGFGSFVDLSAFRTDTFRAEEYTITAILEKARSRAMANINETPHGVCYIAPNYVIFEGSNCTAMGSELIPANQNIASLSDFANMSKFPKFVFTQLSGRTTGATIAITDGIKNTSIAINNEGTINW
ncbi:MAG: prepilin-type N-terminal cleavage/methylation domain-containing protein [Candidatus Pacebacteria bacterium]|nr:prepilin-type N-terminal cleavage/methylation domain-containing protein [Candidatus Paceibacterota bacterium]